MNINSHSISFAETRQFSDLFLKYISDSDDLKSFYSFSPSLSGISEAIQSQNFDYVDRKTLVKVLTDQYSGLSESGKVSSLTESNIEAFLNQNTFSVTTGHQLCLFTGPLYFIYKIATTISLSKKLKEHFPHKNFIPVFWMASEDHDIEEVNHVNVFNKKITWDNAGSGASGRLSTANIDNLISELETIVGTNNHTEELIQLFKNAYLGNKNLADATRYLVNFLFGNYGLVVINPDDKRLKETFVPLIIDDIIQNNSFHKTQEAIHDLQQIGVTEIQVNPREVNFFYLEGQKRERIIKEERGYILGSDIKSSNEVVDVINRSPERISPNVVTRGLYQQFILPNIAYVGGPGEVAYWLEFKAMFDHYKIPFPVLMPRNFFMWIDKLTMDRIKKLHLDLSEVFIPFDALLKKIIKENADNDISLKNDANNLSLVFDSILKIAIQIDSTLKGPVEAERQKALNALGNLESKMFKALKSKNEIIVNQLEKLKQKLFPEGILQERHENFIPYYLKYGKSWIDLIIKESAPFNHSFTILTEE